MYKPRSKLLAIVSAKIPSEIDIRKRPYLKQMADNQKNKGALLSRSLKVGESKVPSEFRFLPVGRDMAFLKRFAIQNQKTVLVQIRYDTGLKFSEFLQNSESFGDYNVNIADFSQNSEYFYCLPKLSHDRWQACFRCEKIN